MPFPSLDAASQWLPAPDLGLLSYLCSGTTRLRCDLFVTSSMTTDVFELSDQARYDIPLVCVYIIYIYYTYYIISIIYNTHIHICICSLSRAGNCHAAYGTRVQAVPAASTKS